MAVANRTMSDIIVKPFGKKLCCFIFFKENDVFFFTQILGEKSIFLEKSRLNPLYLGFYSVIGTTWVKENDNGSRPGIILM